MRLLLGTIVALLAAAATYADTIELKDGRTLTGRIVKETELVVWLEGHDGQQQPYNKSRIKRIVRDSSPGAEPAPTGQLAASPVLNNPAAAAASALKIESDFAGLDEVERQIRNARAEYILQYYQKVLSRLEPLSSKGSLSEAQKSAVAWFTLDAHLRLSAFDRARELLANLEKEGTPTDKTRAKAYTEILEANAKDDYGLRRIGTQQARNFLKEAFYSDEFISAAKDAGALARADVWRAAVEEYCNQILTDPKISAAEFHKSLDVEATTKAVREMPRTGSAEKYLPFLKDKRLEHVLASLDRVDAIIPDYTKSYRLDLVRIEADHLYHVLERIFAEVFQTFPGDTDIPRDAKTGKPTKEGREQFRERCEIFARDVQRLIQIAVYVKKKVSAYPRELRRLNGQYSEIIERLKGVQNDAKRKGASI
ncbi:MAG TPA: hypothetical protein VGM03_11895 [Phycisphaerae bacterium]|jgi:hypothetical protein